jgi:iron complex outermembrane receptor protein
LSKAASTSAAREDPRRHQQLLVPENGRAPATVSSDLLQPSTSLSFAGIPAVMSYDVLGVLNKYYDKQPARPDDQALQDWGVTEKITTAYAKLGIDADLGPIPVRGALGLQAVNVDQKSRGATVNGGKWAASPAAPTTPTWLPSLNLNFDLDKYLSTTNLRRRGQDGGASADVGHACRRFGRRRRHHPHVERQRRQSEPGTVACQFVRSVDGKSTSASAAIAGALWYKKLQSYIYNQQTAFSFAGFPNPSAVIPLQDIGTLNRPANGTGGMVKGVELSGALDAGLLWRRWKALA